MKTDQEPSIAYLIKDLVGRREEGQTKVEEAPIESKGSNGIIERTVQEVEGILRSVYLGLQERLGRKVSTRERIVAFIPDYVGYLVNRLKKAPNTFFRFFFGKFRFSFYIFLPFSIIFYIFDLGI